MCLKTAIPGAGHTECMKTTLYHQKPNNHQNSDMAMEITKTRTNLGGGIL